MLGASLDKALISIIVPIWNEEAFVLPFYEHLLIQEPPWELIIVNAGGPKHPLDTLAEKTNLLIVNSLPGRGLQMNIGATHAKGSIFLFLHIDLKLPPQGLFLIRKTLLQGYGGGGFFKKFVPTHFLLWINQILLNWIRASLFSSLVGTNGIFCQKDIFMKLQGFREWPFLEDVDFSDRLKRATKLKMIRKPILVSARKYQKDGVFQRTWKNIYILFLYRIRKRSPEELIQLYQNP